jgi:hypothetical protein
MIYHSQSELIWPDGNFKQQFRFKKIIKGIPLLTLKIRTEKVALFSLQTFYGDNEKRLSESTFRIRNYSRQSNRSFTDECYL